MNLWQKFLRAEYQWQPGQPVRRLWRLATGMLLRERATLRLPWGYPLTIDPREAIGRSIVALNTLDLPVTEAIWRLLDDGDTCADVGANIGYMTSVMAARLHAGGTVHSFEPVPGLAAELEAHAAAWKHRTRAKLQVYRIAFTDTTGPQVFRLPAEFGRNRGLGRLAEAGAEEGAGPTGGTAEAAMAAERTFTVAGERMDAFFAATPRLALVKIDVEGGEQRVLAGAEALLRARRIRDLVLEEFAAPDAAASLATLRGHGYAIFRLARGARGPVLLAAEANAPDTFDPPAYLATSEPERARARFAAPGWQMLTKRPSA